MIINHVPLNTALEEGVVVSSLTAEVVDFVVILVLGVEEPGNFLLRD